jgi:hypothetical protein
VGRPPAAYFAGEPIKRGRQFRTKPLSNYGNHRYA